MNKFKKSQILMLSLLAALLLIAPLLSSSLRPTYLYFVLNFLIISLGVEAGLLSFFSRPLEDNRKAFKPIATKESSTLEPDDKKQVASLECSVKKDKVVEKSASEKIPVAVKVEKVKKCPSMPSLFFIGGGEADAEDVAEEYEEEEEDKHGGQELFAKAETFIGNFYKQLKMQREESWKRIHGFYQKAF
ncbi:hypothetical protein SLE2022_397240 [Rubroshorea leprosula]